MQKGKHYAVVILLVLSCCGSIIVLRGDIAVSKILVRVIHYFNKIKIAEIEQE